MPVTLNDWGDTVTDESPAESPLDWGDTPDDALDLTPSGFGDLRVAEQADERKATMRRQVGYDVLRSGGPLLDLLARRESLIPQLLLPREAPGSLPNVLRRLPLGAGGDPALHDERVRAISEAAYTVEEGIRSAGHTENLPLLPAALVPGVAPAMGILFGGQAIGAGAGQLSAARTPEEIGSGAGQIMLGAPLAIPGVRGKSFLQRRTTPATPADVPALAAEIESAVRDPATLAADFEAALGREPAAAQGGTEVRAPAPEAAAPDATATAPPSPAPAMQGMGAMAAGELTPTGQTATSIRNAKVETERAQRGLPPAVEPLRRSFGTVWDEAMAKLDRDPATTDRLLGELRDKPRSLTDAEDALLLHRQVELQNEFGKATRDLARAYEDGQVEVAAAEQVRVNLLGDQLRDLYDIGKRAGTETARGLAARRMFANEDFTLASMTMEKRAANAGRSLTPAETAALTKAQARIAELEAQLAEAISKAEADAARKGGKGGGPGEGPGSGSAGTPARDVALDPAVLRTRRTSEEAKAKWRESVARDRFAQLTTPQRLFHHAKQTYDAARVLLTSFDFSAVLRQGKFIVAGHPVRGAKALPDMFRAFRSKAAEYRVEQEIANRPNARLYRDSGLYLAERDSPLTRAEEAYTATWAKRIPGVAGSQRAYNTFLNRLRADSFDSMAASLPRGRTPTPAEATAIADFINAATGRGSLGALEKAAVGMNRIFFAPRYVASRFQLILGTPAYKGTAATRALIAKEYARTLAGYAIFYTLSKQALPDAEVETDPRSSDAGKLRIGNTRMDPLAGLQQNTVLLARLGTGETTTLRGRTQPIRGDRVPYGGTTVPDVLARFARSKLAPVPGAVVNVLTGEDIVGQPVTPASTLKSLTVPISWQDIAAAMEDQGVARGTALGILSLFGEGLQVHDEQPRR